MRTVFGFICVVVALMTTLAFCQCRSNNERCRHLKHQKVDHKTAKTLSFAVFYAGNAIDTVNVDCYDYCIDYGWRNGICSVDALVDDTAYCKNCRVYYVREVYANVCTTSAPVKILKFE